MIIPESEERTVRIPVQWIDGHWQLMGGGKLPELTKNACADLMLPATFLADVEQQQQWTREIEVGFLEAGTELYARVSMDGVPLALRENAEEKKPDGGVASLFVKIILQESVVLALTLGKKGKLAGGACAIPCLASEVKSVNEAYTKIVRAFKPTRRSATGNVFSVVYIEENGRMVKLDALRERATTVAAMQSARPRERSETWCELATTLSRVHEVWNRSSASSGERRFQEILSVSRTPIPLPLETTEAIEKAGQEYYDFRFNLMLRRNEGLIAIVTQFHDPHETSKEIRQLRELNDAMDRAVLSAYGWDDLAKAARCDFLHDDDQFDEDVGDRWPGACGTLERSS